MEIKSKEIVMVSVSELIHHPKNMNEHSEDQINRLVKLIEYQGFRNALVVQRGTNLVVAGNGRLMAAKKMGLKEVPVTYQEFDSEAQLYAYMTSDNAIASWSQLDMSKINTELLSLGDLDIELLGLKDFEVVVPEVLVPLTDEDAVPEIVHPITRRGDIWILGNHRLCCGDSTMIDDVERLMNGEKADMVFTDPPYGISVKNKIGEIKNDESLDVFRDSMQQLYTYSKHPSHVYVWCSSTLIPESGAIFSQYFDLKNIIPSMNTNLTTSIPKYHFRHNYEPCLFGMIGEKALGTSVRISVSESTKNDSRYSGDGKLSVYPSLIPELKCSEPNNGSRLHPTMKKVDTICFYIDVSSMEGDIILDLFLGSGSTLIACEKTNRKCYGMELDEKYCDVIIKRFEQYTGKKATLELTNQTYEELKQERENVG
jgi:DNA modification methylase